MDSLTWQGAQDEVTQDRELGSLNSKPYKVALPSGGVERYGTIEAARMAVPLHGTTVITWHGKVVEKWKEGICQG